MTARKRTTGEEFQFNWGKGTVTFRTALLLMVAAATPPGQQVLKNFGILAPGAANVAEMQSSIENVRRDVAALTADVAALKTDVAAGKSKIDKLDVAVTGFQVDFEKYKKSN